MTDPGTILGILERRTEDSQRIAYEFLQGDTGGPVLTYGELATRVGCLAAVLQDRSGERATLAYLPGLDFIIALLGCMSAGVIPVPVYPPMGARPERRASRILHVASDAESRLCLTTLSLRAALTRAFEEVIPGTTVLATDEFSAHNRASISISPDPDSLAMLQYTSGSTALPRGVMLTHRNLMANLRSIRESYGYHRETRGVSWLPPYHDMGLIGGILEPLYTGFPVVLMSPLFFLQNPWRWLETISHTRATTSPSPNFGYDLCVQKIPPESVGGLDLSSWDSAICGAEPISSATLRRFASTFAPAGFRMSAFRPSYGLAEATLLVAAPENGSEPSFQPFDRAAMERGKAEPSATCDARARVLIGNGQPAEGMTVRIVDPVTCCTADPGSVGEIWIQSPGVAAGYWKKPELTGATFHGYIAETGEGPFLRTGDTGFWHRHQLFVTGRIKDLIIVGGRNHYPEDLEMSVCESHEALRGVPGAAFSVQTEGQEMLVILHEVKRQVLKQEIAPDDLFRAIHGSLFGDDIRADAIVLLKPGGIPRTTSGKIQRHACRALFLQKELDIWAEWRSPRAVRAKLGEGRLPAPPTMLAVGSGGQEAG